MSINKVISAVAFCDFHQKLSYASRKAARRITNRHPTHKTPYRCTVQPTLWHIGTPHPLVVSGEKTKDQIRNSKEDKRAAGVA